MLLLCGSYNFIISAGATPELLLLRQQAKLERAGKLCAVPRLHSTMSFKTLDPIKEYRSKQFRTLPIVDLAASCCSGSLDNLSCISGTDYHRIVPAGGGAAAAAGDAGSFGARAKAPPAVTRLNKAGAKSVMKCVLRTLSPVSICGRLPGRDSRVDDGEDFYEMVLGPKDQPREVCRLTNANFNFVDTHDSCSSLDASPRADSPGHSTTKHHAAHQQPLNVNSSRSPEPAHHHQSVSTTLKL